MGDATRAAALERLDALAGEWTTEARFSFTADPVAGRVTFEWTLGRQFLVERSEAHHPDAPDGLAIISVDEAGDGDRYVQHYFDSRGVVRLYRMTLRDGLWTLVRDAPDFTPLTFAQRYTGTFAPDGGSIAGHWETSHDHGTTWELDFEFDLAKVA
jgi:hypothetical protein